MWIRDQGGINGIPSLGDRTNTPELETLEFFFSVVRLLKPRLVVETGTWHGYSAIAMARALRQNGFGKIVIFETDTEECAIAQRRLEQENLAEFVDVRNESSLVGSVNGPIDLLLLDSELPQRISEFEYFRPQLSGGAIVIFHDTSTIHRVIREGVQDLVAKRLLACVMFPSPRGLAICQYQGDMGG
jgi:predicted O-methyltransferase YrrM